MKNNTVLLQVILYPFIVNDSKLFTNQNTFFFSVHSPPSTKEHIKDVHWRPEGTTTTAASTASLFDGLFTTTVINLPLLGVREYFICLGDLLELE